MYAVTGMYPALHRINVFARSKLRGFKIHARAIVPRTFRTVVDDFIFLLCLGVYHVVRAGIVVLITTDA